VHTFVPDTMRGGGVAGKITRHAFEYCEQNGLKVVPTCTYISDTFLPKNKDLARLCVDGAAKM
jgi:predicted GNAT family acetyltransferase